VPEGGRVRVLLRQARAEEEGRPSEGSWFLIEVADEGPGVPKEIRDRIFEPWFTTKNLGSGLGLAICFSVAKNHGGSVRVTDAPGGGALFQVFLPLTAQAPSAGGEGATVPVMEGRPVPGRRLLLVEDEGMLRDLLHKLCVRAGYLATSADSTSQAWSEWEGARWKGEPFDLVIVDMRLGGEIGGMALFERIREREGSARVIVSSGYSDDQVLSSWRDLGFAGLLRKPYGYETFVAAVESALISVTPSTGDR
jgi:CheY-like chemotaxis protein